MKSRDWVEDLILVRHRNGWTQADAASRLGVSTSALRSWEWRRRKPKPITVREVERFITTNSQPKGGAK